MLPFASKLFSIVDFVFDMDLRVVQCGSAIKRLLPEMGLLGSRAPDFLKAGFWHRSIPCVVVVYIFLMTGLF